MTQKVKRVVYHHMRASQAGVKVGDNVTVVFSGTVTEIRRDPDQDVLRIEDDFSGLNYLPVGFVHERTRPTKPKPERKGLDQ